MKYTWTGFLSENKKEDAGIIVCINENDKVLIIRRGPEDAKAGIWTIPGGHIDPEDNSIESGAARELFEETNLSADIADLEYLGMPKPGKYYFLATSWSGSVKIDKPNPKTGVIEHDDYKWAAINDIKDIEDSEIPIYLLEKALEMSKNEINS
jgi:8-oxo-dGTP pyrophosphatase MutT (NUDIX family)